MQCDDICIEIDVATQLRLFNTSSKFFGHPFSFRADFNAETLGLNLILLNSQMDRARILEC